MDMFDGRNRETKVPSVRQTTSANILGKGFDYPDRGLEVIVSFIRTIATLVPVTVKLLIVVDPIQK